MTARAAPVAAAPAVLPEPPIAATVPEASAAPLAEPAAVPAEPQSAFDTRLALILGALGALALLAWGFIAAGRRRNPAEAIAVPVIERLIIADRTIAEPEAVASAHDPIAFAPRPAEAAASLSHSGASVALPKTLPATYAEREALLQRMADAKPDRANPFTDRHARTRRARLIMQSLGRTFDRAPRIDLSQYPENWPELARMNYATAA
ncbi:MAG: hypothetical protein ABIO26_08085 [Croceibacterium sp.]